MENSTKATQNQLVKLILSCLHITGVQRLRRGDVIELALAELKDTSKHLPARFKEAIEPVYLGTGLVCRGVDESLSHLTSVGMVYYEAPSYHPLVFDGWGYVSFKFIKEYGISEVLATLIGQEFKNTYDEKYEKYYRRNR